MKNNDDIQIDLIKLFKALWRRALVIILVAVVFASAVFAYTLFFVSPAYDATASIYVNNSSFSFGSTSFSISASELNASNSLVNTYIYILKSRTTLEDVIAKGNLPYTYGQLAGMISTKTVSGTAAFDITVRSSSPTEAEYIANIIAQILPDRIAEIVDGSSVRIVDYAIVPAHRSAPSYTKNTVIGALIGGLLAAAVVVVRFLIEQQNDEVVHSADELRERYPDIKVLAMIPDMTLSEKKGYYYSSYYGDSKKGRR
jgi:capsular polysaccharide biosynthesis protein